MKKGILLGVVFCLLVLGFVSATNTEIKINTLSNHTLNLQFLDPEPPLHLFNSTTLSSGESGVVDYIFSNNAETFDLLVILMDGNKKILDKRFEDLIAGEKIMLTLISAEIAEIDKDYQEQVVEEVSAPAANETEDLEEIVNETIETDTENSVGDKGNISAVENASSSINFSGLFERLKGVGFASSGEEGTSYSKNFYYGIAVVLILVVMFFVFRNHPYKLGGGKKDADEEDHEDDEDLDESEEELEKMKVKVEKMKEKKQDKIKEVKKKLIEDEKELMRLREKKKKEKEEKKEDED